VFSDFSQDIQEISLIDGTAWVKNARPGNTLTLQNGDTYKFDGEHWVLYDKN